MAFPTLDMGISPSNSTQDTNAPAHGGFREVNWGSNKRSTGHSKATHDGECSPAFRKLIAEAPPSSGKLVWNTPFLEAGVLTSMVTRKARE